MLCTAADGAGSRGREEEREREWAKGVPNVVAVLAVRATERYVFLFQSL